MSSLDKINAKIVRNWNLLPGILDDWKKSNLQVVFTNGCFDILHRGHLELLSKAADMGDKLVVALNSDDSVKRLKGPGRPLQDEISRALIMAGFSFVSLVVLFPQDTPFELINLVKPDVLVKGGDYKAEEIVGYDVVTNNKGKVVVVNFVEGFSTTSIVNKIKI